MTREEAIEVLHHTIAFESGFAEAKRMAIEALEKEPNRAEGEWVDIRWQPYFCSICKTDAYFDEELGGHQLTNYCPHCGAKMKG